MAEKISEELLEIINTLKNQGKMVFLEGAKKEEISKFELENGITFPEEFREWLLFSDGGECFVPAGVQFYGVAHKPLIDIDNDDRPEKKYVVIGALASGDPILCEKEVSKISIYNREAERIEEDEVYENFFEFLKDLYNLLGIGG